MLHAYIVAPEDIFVNTGNLGIFLMQNQNLS